MDTVPPGFQSLYVSFWLTKEMKATAESEAKEDEEIYSKMNCWFLGPAFEQLLCRWFRIFLNFMFVCSVSKVIEI